MNFSVVAVVQELAHDAEPVRGHSITVFVTVNLNEPYIVFANVLIINIVITIVLTFI